MVKIVTKFDTNVTKSLNKFAIKKLLPFYIIFSLAFIFLGLCSIPDEDGTIWYGIFLIAIGVLFFPICLLLTKIGQKNFNKSMSLMSDETIFSCEFGDNEIYMEESKGSSYFATIRSDYTHFYKVYETDTHYFLYISKQQCHVLPKCDIVEGTVEELNILLFRHLGPKKFILKKGKK